jgi:hypothetical protein
MATTLQISSQKMPAEATTVEARSAPFKVAVGGRKAKLISLADIDRRGSAYRRVEGLISSFEADLGGRDSISVAERQLLQRSAVLGGLCESIEAAWLAGEEIDPVQYTTLINAQRRCLESVGLQRRSRDVSPPSLASYLAERPASVAPIEAASTPIAENAKASERASESHSEAAE